MNALSTYFRESLQELHQVRWPTQKQSIRLTTIVIGFIIVTSLGFGLVDTILSEIIRLTIKV